MENTEIKKVQNLMSKILKVDEQLENLQLIAKTLASEACEVEMILKLNYNNQSEPEKVLDDEGSIKPIFLHKGNDLKGYKINMHNKLDALEAFASMVVSKRMVSTCGANNSMTFKEDINESLGLMLIKYMADEFKLNRQKLIEEIKSTGGRSSSDHWLKFGSAFEIPNDQFFSFDTGGK